MSKTVVICLSLITDLNCLHQELGRDKFGSLKCMPFLTLSRPRGVSNDE